MSNIAILTIGPPGSGKSTWGEKFAQDNGYTYLSSDRNRARVGTGEDDQKASARAFALLRKEMDHALLKGQNVLVDACFVSKKSRHDFIVIARKHAAYLKAVTFELDRNVMLERNMKRAKNGGRNVPVFVIDRMLRNYVKPEPPEFDEVETITK